MAYPTRRPIGVWLLILFFLFSLVLWFFGQTLAVIAYDLTADWGLQEPRDSVDPAIVEFNRAIGLTDTILQYPLFIAGIIGLYRMRFYGAVASWMALAISVYWPVMWYVSKALFAANGIRDAPLSPGASLVPLAIVLISIWGVIYLYRRRDAFT